MGTQHLHKLYLRIVLFKDHKHYYFLLQILIPSMEDRFVQSTQISKACFSPRENLHKIFRHGELVVSSGVINRNLITYTSRQS